MQLHSSIETYFNTFLGSELAKSESISSNLLFQMNQRRDNTIAFLWFETFQFD
jgi:hypothetical protein